MLAYLKRLTDERDSLTATATALTDKAATEQRDLSETEAASLATMQTRCAEIDGQLVTYDGQATSMRAYATLRSRLTAEPDPEAPAPPPTPETLQTRSWGDLVLDSAQFREYHGHGRMAPVDVPFEIRQSHLIKSTDFDVGIPKHTFTPPEWQRTSPFLDAIGTERVSSNSVEWLYWPPPDPEAQVVAEGAQKPEAEIPHEAMSASLLTLAHWSAVTRQAIEDFPRLRSIIETKLRNGLTLALENAAGAAITGATLQSASGADLLTAIRNAVAEVQGAGWTPNAVLLNPADWAAIDVQVMGGTLLGPAGAPSFWGMRPVSVPALPAGTAYVGDFNTAVTLFDRGVASVFMTDSHAALFISNVLIILAETRALPVVTTPAAIVKASAGGGSGNGGAGLAAPAKAVR